MSVAARVAIGVLVAVSGFGTASVARAADLESEIKSLVESHPEILYAREKVQSADQGIRAARSGYYPQVHINANTGPEHWNNEQLVDTFGAPITREGYGGGVTVTEHLYDGNATNSTVDAAIDNKSVSESTLRDTRQSKIQEGVKAYLEVQRLSQLVALARTDEQNTQTQLHLQDESVQRGSGQALDVLDAKNQLQIAKDTRLTYESQLEQAIDKYEQVFGHAPDNLSETLPEPPADLVPATIEDALKIAAAENPKIEGAKRAVHVGDDQISVARAGYYPTLDLVGKADMGENRDGNFNMSRDWEVLLELNWDPFNGFKTQAQVAQAAHDASASKDSAVLAERNVNQAVRVAWAQLDLAKQRITVLESALNYALDRLDAQKKLQKDGKAKAPDVLRAESAVIAAQIKLLGVKYDMRSATYDLFLAMGRLEPGNLDRPEQGGGTEPAPAAK